MRYLRRIRTLSAMMHRIVQLLGGVFVLGATLVGSTAMAAPRICPAGPRHLIAADGPVKAYRVPVDARAPRDTGVVYACMPRRRRVSLGYYDVPYYGVTHVRAAAPYVAAVRSVESSQRQSYTMVVRNVRTAAIARVELAGAAKALELTGRGTAIVLGQQAGGSALELRYRTNRGRTNVLAVGAIEPASLAVSRDGRYVYWKQDGVAAVANVP